MTVTTPADRFDVGTLLTENTFLIGGRWVPAVEGGTIDVINPATREVLLRVPAGGARDVDAAVDAATTAFPGWRDTSPADRADLLSRWAELCRRHAGELDTLEAMEVGRPRQGGSPIPRTIGYIAGLADKVTGVTLPTHSPDVLGLTLREPYGVCGSIIPWNIPGKLMAADVAPAIAAGNTVVVKPAEDAPLTCLYLAKLAELAGIPPGVINVVVGYGADAGAALPAHPGIRRMSFTGSPETGSRVMAACARNLIPLHLELGGKSPQIVLRDADLAYAVPAIVRSLTFNAGQVCAAGTRLLVDRKIKRDVVAAVCDALAAVRVGPWYEPVDMGPLISARQEQRVLEYLDIGRAEGARVVRGGHKLTGEMFDGGFFVAPTVFDEVEPGMRIAQEEIFGPVLSVLTFDDEDEALSIANGTRYGLVASVWTGSVDRAIRLSRAVQAGQVYVNTMGSTDVIGAPFGGYRHSGFGRTMSADSILDYTQTKTLVLKGIGQGLAG
ncbi:aldehyde dehydrogenase family protein [Dactylosporangium sp. CA-233914]|uniref:aldehyde dehydrogenase family protein n=1 Tax=Dactylosporangium sp. CA-233914 TaxID=3239934 RepID=UPI003D94C812